MIILLPMLPEVLVFAVLGGLSAWLAHRGLSTYHDGLRPLMPEYRRGELGRPELTRRAWDMSVGFILFYALPFSLVGRVMISHTIFLAADVIGMAAAAPLVALIGGALYGGAAALVVEFAFRGMQALPVNFVPQLGYLVMPLGNLIGLMPVLAIGQQYGLRLGALALFAGVVVRVGSERIGLAASGAGLSPDGVALLFGAGLLLGLALRRRGTPLPAERVVFAANFAHLRRGLTALLPVGALAALAAHFGWLAGEPVAALLVGDGRFADAAVVALFSAIGFLPLVISTSAVTGAHTSQGDPDWVLAAGYLAASPPVAAAVGAALMLCEVLGVPYWLWLLGRFPDLRAIGPVVRDALGTVTEIGLLVGGLLAANQIWPATGLLLAAGGCAFNETAGRPILRLAAPPIAAIAVGLLVNVLALLGVR